MLLAVICAAIVIVFFWSAFSKPKLVPRGVQNLGELGIFFVRDQILRPMIGKKGDGYLPFLVSLFFFVWIMNIMEIIPAAQFPSNSEIAFPVALMLMVYGLYNYLGIKHQGLGGYFSNMIPKGVPVGILVILAPVEILQYIIVRPFTLAVRLFANMFAGHILLLMFTLATWYLLTLGCRPAVERGLVPHDSRADGVRAADPGTAGLHLHDPDRAVHRWSPRSGTLMFYVPAGGMSAGDTEKESTDACICSASHPPRICLGRH